jgi:hypothetical protein
MRCGGIGASGRFGRLLDRSGNKLELAFLNDSERLNKADVAAAFASFSRRCCSLLSRTSDFRGSLATDVAAIDDLASAAASVGAGLVVVPSVALTAEVFASSTSPSSTSAVVVAFGVDKPWELRTLLAVGLARWASLTHLALDPGLNSGAVGLRLLFEGELLA